MPFTVSASQSTSPGARGLALLQAAASLAPRSRTSLRTALAADTTLFWLTTALWAAACLPLLLTPFLPFSDLGINTAASTLLWDAAFGNQPAATFYRVQWAPVPYWTTYAACTVLARVLGPLVAAKLLTAFIFLLLPLGIMRLLLALGRDARLGLWAFALVWEHNLYAGWLAFLVGIGLVCFVLAWMIEAESLGDALRIAPFTALVALTHVQAVWLLGVAAGATVFTTGRFRRRVAVHTVALLGLVAIVGPWLLMKVGGGAANPGAAFAFEWHTPATKIAQFFAYTLDNVANPEGERTTALVFAVMLFGPLALGLLPARQRTGDSTALALLLVAIVLYAALPWAIWGPISHWYTYPRYATVILFWLLLIPAPRLDGWKLAALAPGIVAALVLNVKVGQQLRRFGERTRPYQEIIAQVHPGASTVALVFDDNDPDPDLKLPPYHQFYAYITAAKRGYDPYLWDNPSVPLVYRPEARRPAPGWGGAFSLDAVAPHYDYVLVQGFQHQDPVQNAVAADGKKAELLIERLRWRLYRVR